MRNGTGTRLLCAFVASIAFACGDSTKHDLDLTRSELRVTPTSGVVADGVQTVTIELIARDTHGLPLGGVEPTLSVSGTANLLGTWTGSAGEATQTASDGTLHITLASTKAELKTIGARLRAGSVDGDATATAETTFVAGPIARDRSVVTPPASSTVADGSTSAPVVVVVRDAQGNPVSGAVVTANVSGGATVDGPRTTGADGTVTFQITSSHSGTVDVTFTVDSTTVGTTQVAFASGPPAAIVFGAVDSTVMAGQPLSSFHVTVLDAHANVASSATGAVTLSLSTNPGSDSLGGTATTSAVAGVAAFADIVLHKAGTGYVLSAAYDGLTSVPSTYITVTPADADADHTLVQASGSPTVGETQSVTVVVRDAFDNPVAGEVVVLFATGGAEISAGGVSDAHGEVTGTVTTTTAGPVTLSAYLGSTPVSQTPTVTFQAASPASGGSTAVPGSPAVADGTATATITVTVKDAYGNPVPGISVSASASNGAVADGPHTSGSDGTATFAVTSTTAGSSTLTFTSGGVTLGSGTVSFVAGAAAKLAFSSAPSSGTAGATLSAVVVRVLDAHGNLVSSGSTTVALSTASSPSGESLAGTLAIASSSGTATFSDLVLHKAGTTTLSAHASGVASATSGAITVGHAAVDAAQSTVSAASATATAGASIGITVTLLDAYGNPISGQTVTLSAAPGSASPVQPVGTTTADGTITGTVSTQSTGDVTVTARVGSTTLLQAATVTYQAGAVDPDQSTFSASPSSLIADGSTTSTLSVTAKDSYGNPASGKAVVLSATGINTLVQGGPTDASGQAQGTIASSEVGTKTLTARVDGVTLATHPTVAFSAPASATPSASRSTVIPSPATIQADGTTQSAIVVTVLDSGGAPVQNASVTLALTSGTGTLTQPSSVTDASGVATGHVSASAAGSGTFRATASGVAITQTATVTYVTAITETVPPKEVPLPIGVNCTTQYSNMGRKITVDQANNIYVVMNCGGTAYAAVSTDLGNTYSTAQSTGLTDVFEVSTVGGPAGIAYALAIDGMGGAWFSRTTDSGATWSAPVQIETMASATYGATIAVDNDWVYVACNIGGVVRVFRNATQGAGTFDYTDVAVSAVFGDVLTDTDGAVWVTTDDPTFHILKSTDHGVTFGPEFNPSGSANYSDWSIGNGIMWATGTQTYATRIPSSAPSTSTAVAGLVAADARGRAVSADNAGNAYIVSGMSGVGVTLQRALAADSAFDTGRPIDANGTWPGVVAGPGNNTAILVYTVGTNVWASVQVY